MKRPADYQESARKINPISLGLGYAGHQTSKIITVLVLIVAFGYSLQLQALPGYVDVTQPGDNIVGRPGGFPEDEGPGNVIDNNQDTKYLNFGGSNSGFVVTPSVGPTLVVGMSVRSANDTPPRDPKTILFFGSNNVITPDWEDSADWEEIASLGFSPFVSRFEAQFAFFDNTKPYRHYRWEVLEVEDQEADGAMQVSEVELLATTGRGPSISAKPPGILGSGAGRKSTGLIRITNNGSEPLENISLDEASSDFKLAKPLRTSLATGESTTCKVTFSSRKPSASTRVSITAFTPGRAVEQLVYASEEPEIGEAPYLPPPVLEPGEPVGASVLVRGVNAVAGPASRAPRNPVRLLQSKVSGR